MEEEVGGTEGRPLRDTKCTWNFSRKTGKENITWQMGRLY
jgi:hypothetical protein